MKDRSQDRLGRRGRKRTGKDWKGGKCYEGACGKGGMVGEDIWKRDWRYEDIKLIYSRMNKNIHVKINRRLKYIQYEALKHKRYQYCNTGYYYL